MESNSLKLLNDINKWGNAIWLEMKKILKKC